MYQTDPVKNGLELLVTSKSLQRQYIFDPKILNVPCEILSIFLTSELSGFASQNDVIAGAALADLLITVDEISANLRA